MPVPDIDLLFIISPPGVLAAYGSMNSDGPPTDIFEAAQRGMHAFITKQVDRSVEFDINQRVRQL